MKLQFNQASQCQTSVLFARLGYDLAEKTSIQELTKGVQAWVDLGLKIREVWFRKFASTKANSMKKKGKKKGQDSQGQLLNTSLKPSFIWTKRHNDELEEEE